MSILNNIKKPSVRLGFIMADRKNPEDIYNDEIPLGFGYIASYIEKYFPGCEVINGLTVDALLEKDVDVIGISSCTEFYELSKSLAEEVKNKSNKPVLIGGVHISVLPNTLTEHMDIAIIGEGEQTVLELMQCFKENGKKFPKEEIKKIDGIAFRDNKDIVLTAKRQLISNLDDIPMPNRERIWIGKQASRAYVFTSRGCPYRCNFCISTRYWPKLRQFSPEYVINELDEIHNKFGLRNVHFFDDLFIAPYERLTKIADLIVERGYNRDMVFTGAVRANLVNDRLCKTLTRMNVNEVMFGAESFSPNVLKYLKNNSVTVEQNQKAIDTLHKYGIKVNFTVIFGSHVESKEELMETFSVIEKNHEEGKINKWASGLMRPYPGTPVWDKAKEMGLVSDDMNWDRVASFGGIYMGQIPEKEIYQMIDENVQRCMEIDPENEMWYGKEGISKLILKKKLKQIKQNLLDFVEKYKNTDKRIYLYGAGLWGQEFIEVFDLSELNILGFIDKDPDKAGSKIGKYTVYSADNIESLNPDMIVLTVQNKARVLGFIDEIKNQKQLTFVIIDLNIENADVKPENILVKP